jgi:hypothetical protein
MACEAILRDCPRTSQRPLLGAILAKFRGQSLKPAKKFIKNRVLIILSLAFSINAETTENPKKYQLSICALFKNESSYLKEWIEYHRLAGVDHFYLYNNGSLDRFREVLRPYLKENLVTLIHWPDMAPPQDSNPYLWPLSTQVTAYENAIKWVAAKKTKWLVFLDVDEFLVPFSSDKITDVLDRYDEYPGIDISSDFFNAAKRGVLPPRRLVIEAIEIKAPIQRDPYRAVKKTIFKPDLCTAFFWPPYECQFQDDRRALQISRMELRINTYENRMRFQRIEKISNPLRFDENYPTQSEIAELLKLGVEIEDPERAIYRFLPALYKNMGMY